MARSDLMSIAIVAIVSAISFQQAFALKCWECSWYQGVEKNIAFCADPFVNNTINNWAYRECPTETGYNVYCRKTIETVNNNATVISRGCYQRPANATENTCSDKSPSSIITTLCDLCTQDGCNNAAQFTATIAFIVASMLFAQILSA